jgi:hypothetical protein
MGGNLDRNPGGVGGPEIWIFRTPDGHEWELTIKREGSPGVPGSEGPRFSLQDKTRARLPNTKSFYDPTTGTWGSRNSPQSHVDMDPDPSCGA